MADPYWTGMTEADQHNWQNYDPRFIETMMANSAAGTLPQPGQIEAARQESAQVFNTPYTPTSYAQPTRNYGNDAVDKSMSPQGQIPGWLQSLIPGGGRNRGNDAVNMDDPYFKPMGPDSIGGYSTADHQLIGRQAGYTGEFGNGLFEAAMVADPSLRQRFNSGVDRFSQNAQAAMADFNMPYQSFGMHMAPNYGGQSSLFGDQQPMGWGQYDFGFGGSTPYSMGQPQQGALNPYPTAGYDRGAFQFARGGRVR